MFNRPSSGEYTAYYERYINLVPEGNIIDILNEQMEATFALLSGISETKENFRYAEGKWMLKEVVGHITDTERIMSYRLLRIARGDKTPLSGYDDEQFVKEASFSSRPLTDLLEDFVSVRRSTITLLRGLPKETESRTGIANNSEVSVRALAYIMAGHELHHMKIIKEKYLI